jgi:uncharacterized protein
MPFMFFDPTFIILIPAMIFAAFAQSNIRSTFNKYLRVASSKGMTGYQVARDILDSQGMYDVKVERVKGSLTDHYDPRSTVVRLSDNVYNSSSIAAISVAAHEVGHAMQHNEGYMPLNMRSTLAPVASFGSSAAWPLVLLGLLMNSYNLIMIGVYVFTAAVVFQLITLPVEFNASSRALTVLQSNGLISSGERTSASKVLRAAAMTYVAATLVAVSQLLRLLVLANGRRRD